MLSLRTDDTISHHGSHSQENVNFKEPVCHDKRKRCLRVRLFWVQILDLSFASLWLTSSDFCSRLWNAWSFLLCRLSGAWKCLVTVGSLILLCPVPGTVWELLGVRNDRQALEEVNVEERTRWICVLSVRWKALCSLPESQEAAVQMLLPSICPLPKVFSRWGDRVGNLSLTHSSVLMQNLPERLSRAY